jgi:hypothetical protein
MRLVSRSQIFPSICSPRFTTFPNLPANTRPIISLNKEPLCLHPEKFFSSSHQKPLTKCCRYPESSPTHLSTSKSSQSSTKSCLSPKEIRFLSFSSHNPLISHYKPPLSFLPVLSKGKPGYHITMCLAWIFFGSMGGRTHPGISVHFFHR